MVAVLIGSVLMILKTTGIFEMICYPECILKYRGKPLKKTHFRFICLKSTEIGLILHFGSYLKLILN